MALTYSLRREGVLNNKRYVEADVTFDSSYPTGGEAVDHTLVGLKNIEAIELVFRVSPDGATSARTTHGWNVVPVLTDTAAVLLKTYATTDTETANTTDLSGLVTRIRFVGS